MSAIAITMLVSGACAEGSGDGASPTRCVPSAEIVAAGSTTDAKLAIAVAAVDDRFEPACVVLDEPIRLSIVVRNGGRHPHNLTMVEGPRVAVDAGQVAILETEVDSDGARFTCTIHPGMDGELRVDS